MQFYIQITAIRVQILYTLEAHGTTITCSYILLNTLFFFQQRATDCSRQTTPCLSHLLPSPVQNLSAEANGGDASVTLKWNHPTRNQDQVKGYEIRYRKLSAEPSSPYNQKILPHNSTLCKLTTKDGIEPLNKYVFEIRPTSSIEEMYTDWTCTNIFIGKFLQLIKV